MSSMIKRIRASYMVSTFLGLKGNPRACVWTEPMWGIPYNLYAPYIALYMTQLGMTRADIGIVTSVSLVSQMISALLSGVLTDKLGRRWCTVIFDLLSWTIPTLLWACSQNMNWFLLAAVFGGLWRITENSWGLLLVEDADPKIIVPMYSLAQLMGLCAAFFAPLSKLAVDAYGIVPTMRVLYTFACISMTAKFLILFFFSTETEIGKRRMAATKGKSIFKSLWECKDVYIAIIKEKRMLLTLGIMAVFSLISTINGNYWGLYLCDSLGISQGDVSLYTTFKSIVLLVCIFALVPRVVRLNIKRPILTALCVFAASQLLLLLNPGGGLLVPVLLLSVACEAVALSVLNPLTSSLLFFNADPEERARICGLVYATVSLIVSVFPMLIGFLAEQSIRYPFYINLVLFGAIAVLTVALSKLPPAEQDKDAA